MSTYAIVNKKAQMFTRPTTKFETKRLQELIDESMEEEEAPPTVRYHYKENNQDK